MAGGGGDASSNASRLRKRVAAETLSSPSPASLKRARDGSAFAKCEECSKDVPVALISFHSCSLDAKIKMNLEAQVIEMASEVKKKMPAKRSDRPKKAKGSKGKKRPPTAFFVFMEDFRKSFKEANPDCKSVATVAKEGGVQWKSMSDEEKKVYQDRAAELKAEYERAIEAEEDDEQDEEDADDSSEKETKDEEVDASSEKEVKKDEEQVDGSVEEEVKGEEEQLDDE